MSYFSTPATLVAKSTKTSVDPLKYVNRLTVEDFNKARDALRKAHVPGPYWMVIAP